MSATDCTAGRLDAGATSVVYAATAPDGPAHESAATACKVDATASEVPAMAAKPDATLDIVRRLGIAPGVRARTFFEF